MGTHNIEILNRTHWPCRSQSILRRATFRKFQNPMNMTFTLTLDLGQGSTVMDDSLTFTHTPSLISIALSKSE